MLKQTAPHEWEIVPTPFPKELKDASGTVLNLARIGFVYQGFDGNFHSFIRRYTYGKPKPVPEDYSFEELLVYGTEQSILIGYVHSYYDGQYNFHRFTYNKIKSGIGYLLFEMQINELDKVKDDIDQTEQGDYKVRNDRLYQLVKAACRREQVFTPSFIQEKFNIGYGRAVAILDEIKKDLQKSNYNGSDNT